jgi:predicted metal-dependent hydrolase
LGFLSERLEIDEIPVEIRRSRRRKSRIGLAFDPAGVVVLEAPLDATTADLEAVIVEHGRWLRHRLAAVQADATCVSPPSYMAGEVLQYVGEAYRLVVEAGPPLVERRRRDTQLPLFHDIRGIVGDIRVRAPDPSPTSIKRTLDRWYRAEARTLFGASIEQWRTLPWLASWHGEWGARYMRSQWGSCSARGRVSLNTHLVKVPRRLLDYVVVHELCHVRHHDHSRRFYALLDGHLPDWEARRDELNAYLPLLLHE